MLALCHFENHNHALTYTHPVTHSVSQSLTHTHTHSLPHSLTHSTHSLTHSRTPARPPALPFLPPSLPPSLTHSPHSPHSPHSSHSPHSPHSPHSLSHPSHTHHTHITHSHSHSLTCTCTYIHTHKLTHHHPPSLLSFLFPSCFCMLSLSLEKWLQPAMKGTSCVRRVRLGSFLSRSVPSMCFATGGCVCVRSSMRFLNLWLRIALEWLHDCRHLMLPRA